MESYTARGLIRKMYPNQYDLERIMGSIMRTDALSEGVNMMWKRRSEFSSQGAALLAGIASHQPSRVMFDEEMDRLVKRAKPPKEGTDAGSYRVLPEIVIGGGLHAAIYCAARVAAGHPKPWVIEKQNRMGGAFAVSVMPSFYLNSRNRPGPLGLPGDSGRALNVLPGAMLQPADLSGDEYQRNSDLAWVIRSMLMASANVLTGWRVSNLEARSRLVNVYEDYGNNAFRYNNVVALQRTNSKGETEQARMWSWRVIDATGMGEERKMKRAFTSDRIMTFEEFMRRMDAPFPLRGMQRVAVIGRGDSGRTVVEALTGQGPTRRGSVASLDKIEKITWYGFDSDNDDYYRAGWMRCNRSRYAGIARLLPRDDEGTDAGQALVQPITAKAKSVAAGYDCVYVDGQPYDYVIECMGRETLKDTARLMSRYTFTEYAPEGLELGQYALNTELYRVGPAAQLPVTDQEIRVVPAFRRLTENAVSIFRYAGRTATLARSLRATP